MRLFGKRRKGGEKRSRVIKPKPKQVQNSSERKRGREGRKISWKGKGREKERVILNCYFSPFVDLG